MSKNTGVEWVKKIIRIRSDYIKVCEFIEFLATKKNISTKILFNDIFEYSLDSLARKGFNYDFKDLCQKRIPKGFSISKNTSEVFDQSYQYFKFLLKNKHDKTLYTAEFTELILYIYCVDNLTEGEMSQLDIDWAIF